MTTSESPTARFLAVALRQSGETQRIIAKKAGFKKPNVLSMMTAGEMKVPLERIPALAEACDVSAAEFLWIAMTEYQPEVLRILQETFEDGSALEKIPYPLLRF